MKKKKSIVRLIFITMIMMMALMVPAFADEVNEDVKEARKGVLQVELVYQDKNGQTGIVGGGSAFLINDDTIVTCYHVIHVEENTENYQWARENIADFDSNNIKIQIVIRNDVTIEARLVQESAQADFAILRLEQPINNRNVLSLKSGSATETQQVFALGFPDSVAIFQNQNTYTYEDVTISDGRVTKTNESDGIKYVQHSATLSSGYSGGPLVDSEGAVVAFNRGTVTENNYSVAISEVTTILDDMGIEYTRADGHTSRTEPDTDDEPQTTERNQETTTERVTEEPTTEPVATEKPTISNDNDDEGDSEGKILGMSKTMFIAVVAIVVVVIIVIIILIIALGGKKKGAGMPANIPQRPVSPSQQTPPISGVQPPRAPQYNTPPVTSYNNDGAGETTVLNEGAGETTVLGGGATAVGYKTLVRVKTGERISLNRPEFLIGKERRRVDYCISDNNSISRVHVKLVNRNGQLFIMDMNATNGTFVNGTKLSPNQEARLSVGDRFKLADEEFQVQ